MKTLLAIITLAGMTASAAAQVCCDPCTPCQTYRVVYKQVMEQKQVTAYRIRYDTVYETRKVVTHKPVWETSYRDRHYTVRKAVCETSTREQRCVSYVPQTVCKPVTVDRGCWQNQTVCVPGPVRNRLTWKPAACVVDPVTGASRVDRAGFVWVPEQMPSRQVVQRVWKPNLVTVQVPETRMVQKVTVRQVPVQTVRYVDEPRVERIPVRTCKMVAEEREVQVPVCVEKRVSVTYTCNVPRLVAFREPICGGVCDPCATGPAVITESPALQAVPQTQPAVPQTQPAVPADGGQRKTFAEKPVDGALEDDGQESVKKDPAAPAPAEADKKPALPEADGNVDLGEEDKTKGGEAKDDDPFAAPF